MEVTKRQSIMIVQEKQIAEIKEETQIQREKNNEIPSYNNISPDKKAKKQRTSTLVDHSSQIAKVENKNRELEA